MLNGKELTMHEVASLSIDRLQFDDFDVVKINIKAVKQDGEDFADEFTIKLFTTRGGVTVTNNS